MLCDFCGEKRVGNFKMGNLRYCGAACMQEHVDHDNSNPSIFQMRNFDNEKKLQHKASGMWLTQVEVFCLFGRAAAIDHGPF